MLITTQAQPPPFLTTSTGAVIKVKEKEAGHKWLGCMLSAALQNAILDIEYYLQSASRTLLANKWTFLSRNVSIRKKLQFFNAIVTPIACFGVGPRCIHNADMAKFDINFRRMIRSVVGAPNRICWGDPWHEMLHIWKSTRANKQPNMNMKFTLHSSRQVSQSGVDALRRYSLHTLHAHWQQKCKSVLKCCFQSSQFCAATSQ